MWSFDSSQRLGIHKIYKGATNNTTYYVAASFNKQENTKNKEYNNRAREMDQQ